MEGAKYGSSAAAAAAANHCGTQVAAHHQKRHSEVRSTRGSDADSSNSSSSSNSNSSSSSRRKRRSSNNSEERRRAVRRMSEPQYEVPPSNCGNSPTTTPRSSPAHSQRNAKTTNRPLIHSLQEEEGCNSDEANLDTSASSGADTPPSTHACLNHRSSSSSSRSSSNTVTKHHSNDNFIEIKDVQRTVAVHPHKPCEVARSSQVVPRLHSRQRSHSLVAHQKQLVSSPTTSIGTSRQHRPFHRLHSNSIIRSNVITIDIMSFNWRLRRNRESSRAPPVHRSSIRHWLISPDVQFAFGDYKHGGPFGLLSEHYTPDIKQLAHSTAAHTKESPERVEAMLRILCAQPGMATVRFLGWSLGVLWRWVFASVHVDVAGIGRIQRALQTAAESSTTTVATTTQLQQQQHDSNNRSSSSTRNSRPGSKCGVLLLPTHRSHLDYLLMSYLCFGFDLKMPLIAAGNNLAIPIIGHVFRYAGAFFIRRTFSPNSVYSKVMSSYLCSALNAGSVVELFIQGGRSRTGLIGPPKVGLVSMAIDAIKKGKLQDVQVVPASIDYDCALEAGSYADILLGKPKEPESLWQVIKSAWKLLVHPTHGCAHVNFAEPVWLGELVDQLEGKHPDDDVHSIAQKVGGYIVQAQRESSVVTPTALVAAVLLSIPPTARFSREDVGGDAHLASNGVSVAYLESGVGFLIRLLREHGKKDVALPHNVSGVRLHSLIEKSLCALDPALKRDRIRHAAIAIKPSTARDAVFRITGTQHRSGGMAVPTNPSCRLMLRYSCGELPSALVPFAVVVLCVRSLPRCGANIDHVINKAQVTFGPIVGELFPFLELPESDLCDAIDSLVDAECLWKNDDVIGLMLSDDDSHHQQLTVLCAVLTPYLHVLASVCECLHSCGLKQISTKEGRGVEEEEEEGVSQKQIVSGTRALLHDALSNGRCRFPEVLSGEDIRACLRILVRIRVVARKNTCVLQASTPVVQLASSQPSHPQRRAPPAYLLTSSLKSLGIYRAEIEAMCVPESPQVVHTAATATNVPTSMLHALAFAPALAPLFDSCAKRTAEGATGGGDTKSVAPVLTSSVQDVKSYLLPFELPRMIVQHRLLPFQMVQVDLC